MRFPPNNQLSYIELSHTIEDGMITYRGLPAPSIRDYWSRDFSRKYYSEDTTFHIGKIEMVANTGTYIDSPYHRYEGGKDLSKLNLGSLSNLEGLVIRSNYESGRVITEERFHNIDMNGKAVLINTNWDKFWGTENYFEGHPYITKKAAQYITQSGASLVGIDSYNIDDTEDGARPAHTILLGENIPIVEHLRGLKNLPEDEFRFFAIPVKVKKLGSFPVRAFAMTFQSNSGSSNA